MPLILSSQDWDELWNANPAKTETIEHPDAFEGMRIWSRSFKQGSSRTLQLRDLWLDIAELQLQDDVIHHSEPESWGPASCFFIAGTIKNCHRGLMVENLESPGHHYLECI